MTALAALAILARMTVLTHLFVSAAAAMAAPADEACGAPDGAAAYLSETTARILLLGESHGAEGPPRAADAFVCLALAEGDRVILSLEFPVDHQPDIDAYLASDGGEAARAALVSSSYWSSDFQEGRTSEAMLALIDAARQRIADGASLRVRAVDHGTGDADLDHLPQPRDQAMARRLQALAEEADRVILIVGNVHARRTQARFGDRVLETIGSIAPADSYASILLLSGSGTSWNCRGTRDGEIDCGIHERSSDLAGAPRRLSDEDIAGSPYASYFADAYDVQFYLGPSTASLPASMAVAPGE